MIVQLFACNSCLHTAIEILGIDLQNFIHVGDIDGDAASERLHMPLKGGSRTERDNRDFVAGAELNNFRDFFC